MRLYIFFAPFHTPPRRYSAACLLGSATRRSFVHFFRLYRYRWLPCDHALRSPARCTLFCIRRVTQKVKKYHFRVITSGGSELLK